MAHGVKVLGAKFGVNMAERELTPDSCLSSKQEDGNTECLSIDDGTASGTVTQYSRYFNLSINLGLA